MAEWKAAIARGDLARVRALLPGLSEHDQLKALHRAERRKNVDLIEVLVSGDFLSHRLTYVYGSPLHYALMDKNHELLGRLLRGGADPNVVNISGLTPLYCSNSAADARLLLAAGADVNAGRDAPLLLMATCGLEDRLKELISHPGVNLNVHNTRHGYSPLHCAAVQHALQVLGQWHRHDEGAQREACARCVEALLAAGADPCALDDAGCTPLAHQSYVFAVTAEEREPSTHRITTLLVAAGDRQWDCVPTPCPGLKAALVPVWEKAPRETVAAELAQLFQRLEPAVQAWLQAALCALHHGARPFGGLDEPLRMLILDMALK